MNIKSILGMVLSILGVIGLLYTVLLFSNNAGEESSIRLPIIYGVLGIILLVSGIGIAETIEDE